MPAAASSDPKFVLTAPTRSGRSGERPGPNTERSAASSTASLAWIPFPCASTKSTSPGVAPAASSARRITSSCPLRLGEINPPPRPPWPVADPRRTPRTTSPRASAEERRSRTTMPQPSARR